MSLIKLFRDRVGLGSESESFTLSWVVFGDALTEPEEIAARGVGVVFVFARGDPGIELFRIQDGSSVKHLGDRCRVHIIDSADHTFTQSGARAALEVKS